jgi:hypothetical protein
VIGEPNGNPIRPLAPPLPGSAGQSRGRLGFAKYFFDATYWLAALAHATLRFTKDCYYFRPTHPCLYPVEVLLRDPASWPEQAGASNGSQEQGGAEPESAEAWEMHGEILPATAVVGSGATGGNMRTVLLAAVRRFHEGDIIPRTELNLPISRTAA